MDIGQLPRIGTYEILTAESILAYVNVNLSQQDLKAQLEMPESFYAGLVKMPALNTANSLINGQCRELQTYAQERLIEYILSGKEQEMTSEADVALKDKIEAERLELIKLGEDLTELERKHYQLMLDTYILQEKMAQEWFAQAEIQVDFLWKALEEAKIDIPVEKKERLLYLVKTQAASITIPDAVLKKLNMVEQPSPIEKAALQLLIEAGALP